MTRLLRVSSKKILNAATLSKKVYAFTWKSFLRIVSVILRQLLIPRLQQQYVTCLSYINRYKYYFETIVVHIFFMYLIKCLTFSHKNDVILLLSVYGFLRNSKWMKSTLSANHQERQLEEVHSVSYVMGTKTELLVRN